ncbi:glycosyltransferase family 4 protein [Ramlibacter sp. G-1-2-2]|uniref:Glycosyltransferase family 4 protein n=1 Tax=Ramlibacter agri TaxID=2728837 RepID=A0A848HAH5_9BURK|nr:glycosyltransferase [Ramlibacter agri]NML47795.1 glycosyltransferase family 4 protein [Ramlibacter agri]
MKNAVEALPQSAIQAASRGEGRVFLSAFGVHLGGGLVLLQALVQGLGGSLQDALMDTRTRGSLPLPEAARVTWIRRSLLARCLRLQQQAQRVGPNDVLFCFNSLPPLLKPAGRVINYVHAPYIVGDGRQVRYPRIASIKQSLERLWFRAGVRNCDEVWVQTPTMARAMSAAYPGVNVQVVPLVDDELAAAVAQAAATEPARAVHPDYAAHGFFYPADGVSQKNHPVLLQAWAALADQGLFPKLYLTLRPAELEAAVRASGASPAQLAAVENLGRMPRAEVLQRLQASSALIFPSRAETFGLPMVEARALGVPVLASERDFVRDVCTPAQTFDPASAASIAGAVRRFVEGAQAPEATYYTAADMVRRLLERAA